jgi:choline/glycine/proline betaine transport protein
MSVSFTPYKVIHQLRYLSFESFAIFRVMSLLATVLVMLFFVTSADSGALVTDYLTAKTENSPTWQRLFWTVLMAALAIILLLVGGLSALQSSIIMSALPFTFIMLLMSWGLLKALKLDVTKMKAIQERVLHHVPSIIHAVGSSV